MVNVWADVKSIIAFDFCHLNIFHSGQIHVPNRPWKRWNNPFQGMFPLKTSSFLLFSGRIEREHWPEVD